MESNNYGNELDELIRASMELKDVPPPELYLAAFALLVIPNPYLAKLASGIRRRSRRCKPYPISCTG